MKRIVVDNCEACESITVALVTLEELGFVIKEQKLSDFHFKELYFLVSGDLSVIKNLKFDGINRVENKLICNCHWSTIELNEDKN
jgi:hypothetical protein